VSFLATDCARARESVSVQLDGELPELALDRLENHLRICPACAAWADQVQTMTQQLRGAEPEVPEERFALPRRARRWSVSSAVALTAAAAVVATMFVSPRPHRAAVGSPGGSRLVHVMPLQVLEPRLFEDGKLPSGYVGSTARLGFSAV
jgi:anti-sigma factor RsiW